jgi:hypothetical protein
MFQFLKDPLQKKIEIRLIFYFHSYNGFPDHDRNLSPRGAHGLRRGREEKRRPSA